MTDWITHTRIALRGAEVTFSKPVLVMRSRRYCWFPSLSRQPSGLLWAGMSASPDMAASSSVGVLSRSRDGGLTWDKPRIRDDSGVVPLLLPDGSMVRLPFLMRPRPGGIGAPCDVLSAAGRLFRRPSGATVTGWPKPVKLSPALGTAGFVFTGQTARGRAGEYLATLYGAFEGESRYSLALAESADGFQWRIRSLIAGADCALEGKDGPCEAALCRLADGRLLCVFRVGPCLPYGHTFSSDDGHTWSLAAAMPAHSVEPSLAVLSGRTLALSGGRHGIYVWINVDGTARDWQPIDIRPFHNDGVAPGDRIDPADTGHAPSHETPSEQVVTTYNPVTGKPDFTTCYTGLVALDDRHLLLIYDRLACGWHAIPDGVAETNSVWVMRIALRYVQQDPGQPSCLRC